MLFCNFLKKMRSFCLLIFVPLTLKVHAQMGKPSITKDNGGTSGTISMGPPDLSDEETQANFMPLNLRCDACMAIAVRFASTLQVRFVIYWFGS